MPNFSPLRRANSRHSPRTWHSRQIALAARVEAPRSGKNRSALAPLQLARSCQDEVVEDQRVSQLFEIQGPGDE